MMAQGIDNMAFTANVRIGTMASTVWVVDQATKYAVMKVLGYAQEYVVVEGFFKFVHWGNTGAAWSLFYGNNEILAAVSILALVAVVVGRDHLEAHTGAGQLALGLIVGGILGNLTDRLLPSRRHVVDFVYFYLYRRGGGEIGFPAFNVADTAICTGVGLLLLLAYLSDRRAKAARRSAGRA
jgi:signal peptidase II